MTLIVQALCKPWIVVVITNTNFQDSNHYTNSCSNLTCKNEFTNISILSTDLHPNVIVWIWNKLQINSNIKMSQ